MALEKELETYNRELANLTVHEGQCVVIQGEHVIGVYVSYEDALKVAYEKCGLAPFIVKIQSVEQVPFFNFRLGF